MKEEKNQLQRLLEDRDAAINAGVLLVPGHFARRPHQNTETFFETTSGRIQREYVTVWGLLELENVHDLLVEPLIELALSTRELYYFDAIVTATITGRQLLDRILLDVEDNGPVFSHIMTRGPVGIDNRTDVLSGMRCLILTDVVVSGSLLADLIYYVRRSGGTPVAAICVVRAFTLQGERLLSAKTYRLSTREGQHYFEMERLHFNGGERSHAGLAPIVRVPLLALANHEISEVPPESVPADAEIIGIDPSTIFPEETIWVSHEPSFTLQETLDHLEKASAIDYGFFKAGPRLVSSAVRIGKLLGHDEVRSKITACLRSHVKALFWDQDNGRHKKVVLVTPVGVVEQQFASFVRTACGDSIETVVFVRQRNSLGRDFFLSPDAADAVKDATVLLLLATVHTSAKLQALGALLVATGARALHVICLLNRMGLHATNFIARVESLMQRTRGDGSPFSFIHLYEIPDLGHVLTSQVRNGTLALLERHRQLTLVEPYQAYSQERREMLVPRDLRSGTFQRARSTYLTDYGIGPSTIETRTRSGIFNLTVRTIEGLVIALLHNLVPRRAYRPLVVGIENEVLANEIEQEVESDRNPSVVVDALQWLEDPRAIQFLVWALLADVPLLRRQIYRSSRSSSTVTGDEVRRKTVFTALRDTIDYRLEELRQQRLQRFINENTEDKLDLEIMFLEAAAHVAFFEAEESDEERLLIAVNMINRQNPLDQQDVQASNVLERINQLQQLLDYYGNEEVGWVLSLWMHSAIPKFHRTEEAKFFKRQLERILRYYDRLAYSFLPVDNEDAVRAASDIRQLRINLGHLLSEIGVFRGQRYPHVVIRYLHRQLFSGALRHNPLLKGLREICEELAYILELDEKDIVQLSEANPNHYVMEKFDEWLFRLGELDRVARDAALLFQFTATSGDDARPYTLPSDPGSVIYKLKQIEHIIRTVRSGRRVIVEECNTLNTLTRDVVNLLSDVNSPLVAAIARYHVDLDELIKRRVRRANRGRSKKGQVQWRMADEYSASSDKTQHMFVLCDPKVLEGTVSNILSNAHRHENKEAVLTVEVYEPKRGWERDDIDDMVPQKDKRVKLSFLTTGGRPYVGSPIGQPGKTLRRQFAELKQFNAGGTITGVENGVLITLDLRSRSYQQASIAEPDAAMRDHFEVV